MLIREQLTRGISDRSDRLVGLEEAIRGVPGKTGTQGLPATYTVQLALLPQVVGIGELLERILEVDSNQGS